MDCDLGEGEYRIVIGATSGGDWALKLESFRFTSRDESTPSMSFDRTDGFVSMSGYEIVSSPSIEFLERFTSPQALLLPLFAGHAGVAEVRDLLLGTSVYSIYPDTLAQPHHV